MSEAPNVKPNNPSLGPVFPTKSGTGNYVGIPLDAAKLELLKLQITAGATPFLKKAPRPDKLGREYFFVEFLPPQGTDTGEAITTAPSDKV